MGGAKPCSQGKGMYFIVLVSFVTQKLCLKMDCGLFKAQKKDDTNPLVSWKASQSQFIVQL